MLRIRSGRPARDRNSGRRPNAAGPEAWAGPGRAGSCREATPRWAGWEGSQSARRMRARCGPCGGRRVSLSRSVSSRESSWPRPKVSGQVFAPEVFGWAESALCCKG
jgi:hypothetical protein